MKEIQTFKNTEFGELEVLQIEGKYYFPATRCAKILGHENPQRAVRKYCKGVTELVTPSEGGMQKVNFIPEGDLYRLIVHSRLPAAERFERWVFEEILPRIRKTGTYAPDIQALIRTTVRQTLRSELSSLMSVPGRKRLCGAQRGIIANLDMPLRQEVDLMLESRKYTYQEISRILLKEYGIRVGKSSIARYAQQVMEQEMQMLPISTDEISALRSFTGCMDCPEKKGEHMQETIDTVYARLLRGVMSR